MTELFNFVIVFVSTLISLVVLGLVAGFSPTLYIAQITVSTKSKQEKPYTLALMIGVVSAIFLLIILFQIIHLDTLLAFIDTTLRALVVSVIFNVVVGAALIYGGIYYLTHRAAPKPIEDKKKMKKSSVIGIASFGFIRTFLSVSGVTATYIAGNLIANLSVTLTERLVYTCVFLATTIIPLALIVILVKRNPTRLAGITETTRLLMDKLNYRVIVGYAVIIFGCSIIIFNLMMALLY